MHIHCKYEMQILIYFWKHLIGPDKVSLAQNASDLLESSEANYISNLI